LAQGHFKTMTPHDMNMYKIVFKNSYHK